MESSDVFAAPALTRFSVAAGFGLVVVLVSFVNAPDIIAQTGPFGLVGIDKWIHVGSYAMVAFLLAYAVLAERIWALVAAAVLVSLVGAGVELIQSTIPWRTMEVTDMYANTIGAAVAVGVWGLFWRYLPVSRPSDSET